MTITLELFYRGAHPKAIHLITWKSEAHSIIFDALFLSLAQLSRRTFLSATLSSVTPSNPFNFLILRAKGSSREPRRRRRDENH